MTNKARTSRDPVCGTEVTIADSHYSTTLRSLVFHFCSEQCLENFTAHPALYTSAQRIADIRPILKKRRLKFVSARAEALRAACDMLRGMKGVTTAVAGENYLLAEYDLRLVTLKQIEAAAVKSGLALKGGLHRFRRDLWKFSEYGELENAAAGTAPCCSRPPSRWR